VILQGIVVRYHTSAATKKVVSSCITSKRKGKGEGRRLGSNRSGALVGGIKRAFGCNITDPRMRERADDSFIRLMKAIRDWKEEDRKGNQMVLQSTEAEKTMNRRGMQQRKWARELEKERNRLRGNNDVHHKGYRDI